MKKIAIALLLATSISVPAQAGIFLHIPGIPGEATDDQHSDEINILSWGQSVANIDNMPVVLPLVVTHEFDKASPKLVEAAILGTVLEEAILTVTRTGGESPFDYIVLTLNEPKVVSINSGGSDGSQPFETVTLTCSTFELKYRETMSDGSPGLFIVVDGSCGGS